MQERSGEEGQWCVILCLRVFAWVCRCLAPVWRAKASGGGKEKYVEEADDQVKLKEGG